MDSLHIRTMLGTIYQSICAVKLNWHFFYFDSTIPKNEEATHAIVYGFINQDKELEIEFLGYGKKDEEGFHFLEPYQESRISYIMEYFEDFIFIPFPRIAESSLYLKYLPRINELKKYESSDEIEITRSIRALDYSRDPDYPDLVRVYIRENGQLSDDPYKYLWIKDYKSGLFYGSEWKFSNPYDEHEREKLIPFHIERNEDKTEFICVMEQNVIQNSSDDCD